MAHGNFKDLPKRIASDKVLHKKSFDIAKNPKYDGYQRGIPSMAYNSFDKNFASFAWSEAFATHVTRDKAACDGAVKI